MVPKRGLEPPRLTAQVPETCASTNSAIWANRSSSKLVKHLCQSNCRIYSSAQNY